MERVTSFTDIVQREVADYSGSGLNAWSHYFADVPNHVYSVVVVPTNRQSRKEKAAVMVMARVVGDKVVIDEDITDRPLYKELMRAGIPREQIILAYAGEQPPEQKEAEE
jgi:hypothetical protein